MSECTFPPIYSFSPKFLQQPELGRLEPGARNPVQVYHVGGRAHVLSCPATSQGVHQQEGRTGSKART